MQKKNNIVLKYCVKEKIYPLLFAARLGYNIHKVALDSEIIIFFKNWNTIIEIRITYKLKVISGFIFEIVIFDTVVLANFLLYFRKM